MKKNLIGIVDYGAGNLFSIRNAIKILSAEHTLVKQKKDFENIDKLIFPGVGAFGDSMKNLQKIGIIDNIKQWINQNKHFLGICIGYQALFSKSEENPKINGLEIFDGNVIKFNSTKNSTKNFKIPHMGWNSINIAKTNNHILNNIENNAYFYFVHSYHPQTNDKNIILAKTNYIYNFPSIINRGNIFATQFHPEKSQKNGLILLKNFIS